MKSIKLKDIHHDQFIRRQVHSLTINEHDLHQQTWHLRDNIRMGFFTNRYMVAVHILQVLLVLGAIGVSVIRLLVIKVPTGAPASRANTMALGMVRPIFSLQYSLTDISFQGAKSLIIISYQLLTKHSARFHKWHSLKANMILNFFEVVFWAAVAFLTVQYNLQFCVGTNCMLSWVVMGIAAQLRYDLPWWKSM